MFLVISLSSNDGLKSLQVESELESLYADLVSVGFLGSHPSGCVCFSGRVDIQSFGDVDLGSQGGPLFLCHLSLQGSTSYIVLDHKGVNR